MANYLEIMDYKGQKVKINIDLDRLEDIQRIEIEITIGDEICRVQYKNGKREIYDSSNSRNADFYDGEYTVYDVLDNTNLLKEFLNRTDSYDGLRKIFFERS